MALREAWLSAPEGRLCPWQQARALALREASEEIHGAPWLPWIEAGVPEDAVVRRDDVAWHSGTRRNPGGTRGSLGEFRKLSC